MISYGRKMNCIITILMVAVVLAIGVLIWLHMNSQEPKYVITEPIDSYIKEGEIYVMRSID